MAFSSTILLESRYTTYACAIEAGLAESLGVDDLVACADGRIGFAGDDLRVLLAQITTDGDLTGIFNVQVFPNGDQSNVTYHSGFSFSSNVGAVFGCTDVDATNYDQVAALEDDGSSFTHALQFIENSLTVTSPTCAEERWVNYNSGKQCADVR